MWALDLLTPSLLGKVFSWKGVLYIQVMLRSWHSSRRCDILWPPNFVGGRGFLRLVCMNTSNGYLTGFTKKKTLSARETNHCFYYVISQIFGTQNNISEPDAFFPLPLWQRWAYKRSPTTTYNIGYTPKIAYSQKNNQHWEYPIEGKTFRLLTSCLYRTQRRTCSKQNTDISESRRIVSEI